MSLDSEESRLEPGAKIKIQGLSFRAEKTSMLANQPYHPISIMRFELSLLSLGAALDQSAPIGCHDISTVALVEAERLKSLIERGPS